MADFNSYNILSVILFNIYAIKEFNFISKQQCSKMNLNNINRNLLIPFFGTLILLNNFYFLVKNKIQFLASPIHYLSCNTPQDHYPRLTTSNPQENKIKKYNIFFLESNQEKQFVNIRAQCAIESAALNNPNANVYVYSL